MAGLSDGSARSIGQMVTYYPIGAIYVGAGFGTLGDLYCDGNGILTTYETIPGGIFTRKVAHCIPPGDLAVIPGPLIHKGATNMAVKIDSKGCFVPDTGQITWQTGTSINGIPAGNQALYKTVLGNIELLDGNQDPTIEYVGISNGSAVLAGGQVTYMPLGGVIDPLVSAFSVSQVDLWAKEDGSLAAFSAVGAGKYTRRVAVLFEAGSTKAAVVAGELVLK
jgi:hypothetical protein